MLALDVLVDNPKNVRDHVGDIDELAASIRQHGLVQPIVVTEHLLDEDRFLILAGHRRVAAARRIGLERVPCIVRHDTAADSDHIALMLVENMQRSNLTAVEKARAMQKLIDRGMNQSDVARRLGIPPSSVNTYIMLLDLSDEELAKIEAGEVKIGDAREAIKRARQMHRRSAGQAVRGRPAVLEPRHFSGTHPLIETARARCDHSTRYKYGGACGQCWEEAIREDAMVQLVADEVAS
jgi:ParB family chromosome partitioning protein